MTEHVDHAEMLGRACYVTFHSAVLCCSVPRLHAWLHAYCVQNLVAEQLKEFPQATVASILACAAPKVHVQHMGDDDDAASY